MEFGDVAFKGKGENRSTREQTQPTYDAGSENRTRDTLDPRSLRRKDALIQPYFDYCASVWDGLSSYLCEKLQKLQNRAARVILQANSEINSSLLLETLKWDKLSLRRRKQKAIMMFIKIPQRVSPSLLARFI